MYEINRFRRLSQALVHFVMARASFSMTIECLVYQCVPNTSNSEQSVSKLLTTLQQTPILLL